MCLVGGLLSPAAAQAEGSELVGDLSTDAVDRIELVDASAFSSDGGSAVIEPGAASEDISYSSVEGNSLVGLSRPNPASHPAGSFVSMGEQPSPSPTPTPTPSPAPSSSGYSEPTPADDSPPVQVGDPAGDEEPSDERQAGPAPSDAQFTLTTAVTELEPANFGSLALTGPLESLPQSGVIVVDPDSASTEIIFYLGVGPDGITDIYRVNPLDHAQGAQAGPPNVDELIELVQETVGTVQDLLADLVALCPGLACPDTVLDRVTDLVGEAIGDLCDGGTSSCAGMIEDLALDLVDDLCPNLQCTDSVITTITGTVTDVVYDVCPGGALSCEQMVEDLVFGLVDAAVHSVCGNQSAATCANDKVDVVAGIASGAISTIMGIVCPGSGGSAGMCAGEIGDTINGIVDTAVRAICGNGGATTCADEYADLVGGIVAAAIDTVMGIVCPNSGGSAGMCAGEIGDTINGIVGTAVEVACGTKDPVTCANEYADVVGGIVGAAVHTVMGIVCPNSGGSAGMCAGEIGDTINGIVGTVIQAVCGPSDVFDCANEYADELGGLVGLVIHTVMGIVCPNSGGSAGMCAGEIGNLVRGFLESVCESSDALACTENLLDRVDETIALACGLVPVAPGGNVTGLPPGAGICVLKVLGTVGLVLNTVCNSTNATACANNLIDTIDNTLILACGLVPVAPGGNVTGLPPGAGTCVLKVLGTVDVVLNTVCNSTNAAACASNLIVTIDETLADACGLMPVPSGEFPITFHTCVMKVLGVLTFIMTTVCQSSNAATCTNNLINKIDDLLGGACATVPTDPEATSSAAVGDACLSLLTDIVDDLLNDYCYGDAVTDCIDRVDYLVHNLVNILCNMADRDCESFEPLLEDCAAGAFAACAALVMAVACPGQALQYPAILLNPLNCVPDAVGGPPPVGIGSTPCDYWPLNNEETESCPLRTFYLPAEAVTLVDFDVVVELGAPDDETPSEDWVVTLGETADVPRERVSPAAASVTSESSPGAKLLKTKYCDNSNLEYGYKVGQNTYWRPSDPPNENKKYRMWRGFVQGTPDEDAEVWIVAVAQRYEGKSEATAIFEAQPTRVEEFEQAGSVTFNLGVNYLGFGAGGSWTPGGSKAQAGGQISADRSRHISYWGKDGGSPTSKDAYSNTLWRMPKHVKPVWSVGCGAAIVKDFS